MKHVSAILWTVAFGLLPLSQAFAWNMGPMAPPPSAPMAPPPMVSAPPVVPMPPPSVSIPQVVMPTPGLSTLGNPPSSSNPPPSAGNTTASYPPVSTSTGPVSTYYPTSNGNGTAPPAPAATPVDPAALAQTVSSVAASTKDASWVVGTAAQVVSVTADATGYDTIKQTADTIRTVTQNTSNVAAAVKGGADGGPAQAVGDLAGNVVGNAATSPVKAAGVSLIVGGALQGVALVATGSTVTAAVCTAGPTVVGGIAVVAVAKGLKTVVSKTVSAAVTVPANYLAKTSAENLRLQQAQQQLDQAQAQLENDYGHPVDVPQSFGAIFPNN
jgi:hypothetical protein